MDKFSLYVPNFLPVKECFVPEKNNACPGCGLALAIRHTYKAIEQALPSRRLVRASHLY